MDRPAVEFEDVHWAYGRSASPGLDGIGLEIAPGELVLVAGASGCGKTTLARCLNGLIPHLTPGVLTGRTLIGGRSVAEMDLGTIGAQVGSIFQDPRSQLFMADTVDEVAFGCRNMGLPRREIWRRVDAAFDELGIGRLRNRSVFSLSNGERQLVALASCHAMGPPILLLDEPSANLDPPSTAALAGCLVRLKAMGRTVVVLEHRLHYLAGLVDRMVLMEEGRIGRIVSGREARALGPSELMALGLRAMSLAQAPVSPHSPPPAPPGPPLLAVEGLACRPGRRRPWRGAGREVLRGVSFEVAAGEIVGILGPNGAGKTTLARTLCGLTRESAGSVRIGGRAVRPADRPRLVYFVVQDSDYQLFADTVLGEFEIGARRRAAPERRREILESLELWGCRDRHPSLLSRGQKQRLTIAGALASEADALVFDEPTSGLDLRQLRRLAGLLKELASRGRGVMVISHDYEFIVNTCSRVMLVDGGTLVGDLPFSAGGLDLAREALANGVPAGTAGTPALGAAS